MSWNGRLSTSFIYLPLILTRQLDLWHCHMGTGYRGTSLVHIDITILPSPPHHTVWSIWAALKAAQLGFFGFFWALFTRHTDIWLLSDHRTESDMWGALGAKPVWLMAARGDGEMQFMRIILNISLIIHMVSASTVNVRKLIRVWQVASGSNELLTRLTHCVNLLYVERCTLPCGMAEEPSDI